MNKRVLERLMKAYNKLPKTDEGRIDIDKFPESPLIALGNLFGDNCGTHKYKSLLFLNELIKSGMHKLDACEVLDSAYHIYH